MYDILTNADRPVSVNQVSLTTIIFEKAYIHSCV